jgi:hypothetical protein
VRRKFLQWAPPGIFGLVGLGVDLMPGNTSWIPSTIIWCIAFLWLIIALIYYFENRKVSQIERNNGKQLKLRLGKLLHDGKDIRHRITTAQNNLDINEQVAAEIHFESWFTDVTNALEDTDYKKMWYENKVVDYRRDQITDYLSACDRSLERLKSIIELTSHKAGSQH